MYCCSMRFTTLWNYIWLIDDVMLILVCLLDELILGFCYSNLRWEFGGIEFASIITLVLQVNRPTKYASHTILSESTELVTPTLSETMLVSKWAYLTLGVGFLQ